MKLSRLGVDSLKRAAQGLVVEHLVADDVDLANARHVALGDGDVDAHPVARQILDLGVDLHAVLAVGVVLALQFLAQLVERRGHEHPPGGQARLAQALLQILGLDVLVAGDVQLGDRRPLHDVDDQHVAVAVELHVAEELGLEQRADDGARTLRVEAVTDPQRQGDQHRARRDALQAVQADVADREGASESAACAGTEQPSGTAWRPAGSGTACAGNRKTRRHRAGRSPQSGSKQEPRDVVVESQHGERQQGHQADLLADRPQPLRQRPPPHPFGRIVQQVPAVQNRHRQQIEQSQRQADQAQERQELRRAQARAVAGKLGDRQRSADVATRRAAA